MWNVVGHLVGLVSIYYFLLFVLPQHRRKNGEPPLSSPIPFIGEGIAFVKDFPALMQSLRIKHGSIFTIVNFGQRMHFITDIRSIRRIWSTPKYFNFADFASTAESHFSGMETKEEIDATGVGADQLSQHAHSMRSAEELENLAVKFQSALNEAVENVDMLHCEEWQTVSLREFTGLLVWYAAGRSLFGKGWLKGVDALDSLRQYAEFEDAAPLIVGGMPKYLVKKGLLARVYLTWNILLPLVQQNSNMVKMEESHPYLQKYLNQLKVPYKGQSDGDSKIAARLNGLLFGINTNTMNLLFWTVARVLIGPKEFQERLREEISDAMEKCSTWKDIKASTPLLTSVIIETMRFHADGNSFRVVEQNCSVSGLGEDGSKTFHFRKGDGIFMLSTYDQLKDVEGANQDTFDGSRWLKHTTDPKLTSSSGLFPLPSSQVLVPFGGGKHLCPGRFFASIEMHYVIAFCLNQYDFQLIETSKLPAKVVELSAPINQPKEKMMIRVKWKTSKEQRQY